MTCLSDSAPVVVKRWPFVESPGEFTERLAAAMQEFPLIGAVRHVLIENPPALAQQPTAPSGAAESAEPAVWVAADTLNSPHPTCISSLAYMSQLDRERGREYVPLYAAPQQPGAHPAITHCDNCGCDWLDNGLNPIGCPYCKQPAGVDRDVAWILLRGSQGEPAGTMTVAAKLQDGSEVVLIRDSGNEIDHAVNLAAALAAQQQGGRADG